MRQHPPSCSTHTLPCPTLPVPPFCTPSDASSTQGMGLGDMFRREGGQLKPVLRELEVPVRAVVLPLADAQAAR